MKRTGGLMNKIEGLHPDMAAIQAARRALKVRLNPIPELLSLAVNRNPSETEHVHRLRVTTRRAGAVLSVFGAFLSASRCRRMRRKLRRIRRAAAEARQDDVHAGILAEFWAHAPLQTRPVLREVLEAIEASRVRSHRAINRIARRYPATRFLRARRRLIGSLRLRVDDRCAATGDNAALVEGAGNGRGESVSQTHRAESSAPRPEATLRDIAMEQLPGMVLALRETLRHDDQTLEGLHAARLIGKRLRYAMEIFSCCFPPAFESEYYRTIERLQEHLGGLNDDNEIASRLRTFDLDEGAASRRRAFRVNGAVIDNGRTAALDELVRHFEERREAKRRELFAWRAIVDLDSVLGRLLGLVSGAEASPVAHPAGPLAWRGGAAAESGPAVEHQTRNELVEASEPRS